jgi:NADPH-dependent 7-cyano-7-deazaguanine reductase QueF
MLVCIWRLAILAGLLLAGKMFVNSIRRAESVEAIVNSISRLLNSRWLILFKANARRGEVAMNEKEERTKFRPQKDTSSR